MSHQSCVNEAPRTVRQDPADASLFCVCVCGELFGIPAESAPPPGRYADVRVGKGAVVDSGDTAKVMYKLYVADPDGAKHGRCAAERA